MPYSLSPIAYRLSPVLLAYILDLIFGDPQWRWHPVRLLGRWIAFLERHLNIRKVTVMSKLVSLRGAKRRSNLETVRLLPLRCAQGRNDTVSDKAQFTAGVVLVVLVVGAAVLGAALSLKIAGSIHPALRFFCSGVLIYFVLSVKDLALEANLVYQRLEKKDLPGARQRLARIVGRDTRDLDEQGVIRGTVETVAESAMDGIVAPLFYAFLGGPVLAWMYKAVNTLDSMVGYKNERYRLFGKASAQLDGLVNLVPAKITAILIAVAGFFYRKDCLSSFRWLGRYFFSGQAANSIMTEAAMAGALRIQLGGLNFYNSVPQERPLIGDKQCALNIGHIKQSVAIVYLVSVLFMAAAIYAIRVIG